MSLSSSPNPAILGQAVTLTATVTPGATGKVTFYDGTTIVGSQPISGGQAAFTTSLLSVGTRSLHAYYSGDGTYAASVSASIPQIVNAMRSTGFAAPVSYGVGTHPSRVTVGDLNGDHHADLVVVNLTADSISVLLGNGDGTFQAATNYSVNAAPSSLLIGDFNGDGKADVAVSSNNTFYLSVLLGNGDGTLQTATNVNTGVTTADLIADDFNRDGKIDLVVLTPHITIVGVLLGVGDGTFQAVVYFPIATGATAIAVGDFNNDGKADLVLASDNQDGFYRLLGNGDGTFQPFTTVFTNRRLTSLRAADFNADGNLDLAMGISGTFSAASIVMGNGDGTFQPENGDGATNGSPTSITVSDFDGDGHLDLATTGYGIGLAFVELLRGNGDGTFQNRALYEEIPSGGSASSDFNNDGKADLVVTNYDTNEVSILVGGGVGDFTVSAVNTPLTQSQVGATFTLTVTNTGNVVSSGGVTVTDYLPSGLTATAVSGTGWNCVLATVTCTRSDGVAISASYPTITLTVNVSPLLLVSSVTNTIFLFGSKGFISAATTIPIALLPDLHPIVVHNGIFARGQIGATYNVNVSNGGYGPTSGNVVLTDTVSAGLTLTSMSGAGWSCSIPTCTRSDTLAGQTSYPVLTITVNVAADASFKITNFATVSGGGDPYPINNTASNVFTFQGGSLVPPASVGIFRSGYFWLQDVNGDKAFNAPPDRAFAFGGIAGDIPITGDWNGNGITKVGIYRPANGLFILDYDGDGQFTGADKAYNLGVGIDPTDVPVVGDWNGDGTSKVGLFRQGFFWILDTNGNGVFEQGVDSTYAFGGVAGDVPVVGDWNGSGTSKIGLFRAGYYWILDTNGNGAVDNVNGVGGDQAFPFGGIAGDVPVVGDWNGDGRSKVGVFRNGFFWVLDTNGNYQFDGTGLGQDSAFPFGGIAGDKPVVGKW